MRLEWVLCNLLKHFRMLVFFFLARLWSAFSGSVLHSKRGWFGFTFLEERSIS